MAVGHHRRRDGAWRWRLDVLVDNLTINAFAVAFAVADVDVVVLVDVVRRRSAVDRRVRRIVVVIVVRVRVDRGASIIASNGLIDSAVAHIRIKIAVRVVRCAGIGVLVDVRHRARIDIRILIDVGHRPRILVDVGVGRCADIVVVVRVQRCAGVHVVVVIGVRGCAGRSVVVVIRVRAGGRIGAVRCAGRCCGVDIFRRRYGYSLGQRQRWGGQQKQSNFKFHVINPILDPMNPSTAIMMAKIKRSTHADVSPCFGAVCSSADKRSSIFPMALKARSRAAAVCDCCCSTRASFVMASESFVSADLMSPTS